MFYVSRLELRELARKLADCQGDTALNRHPDSEVNSAITRGVLELYRLSSVVNGDTGNRWLSLTTFNTVVDQSDYGLPLDFFRLAEVTVQFAGRKLTLSPFQSEERSALTDATGTSSDYSPLHYRVLGENIEILPVPKEVLPVELWYVSHPGGLNSDVEMFDVLLAFDDFVAAYAAKEMAIKDKSYDLIQYSLDPLLAKREAAIVQASRQRFPRGAKVRDVRLESGVIRNRWRY